jgi:hypothetical protein
MFIDKPHKGQVCKWRIAKNPLLDAKWKVLEIMTLLRMIFSSFIAHIERLSTEYIQSKLAPDDHYKFDESFERFLLLVISESK